MFGDQIIESREQSAVDAVRTDDKRRRRAGHILLGNIHAHLARIGCRMARGDDQFGGVLRIGGSERALFARDSRINLAVLRVHVEGVDRSLRHAIMHRHLRSGVVCGPRMKLPSAVGGAFSPSGNSFADT